MQGFRLRDLAFDRSTVIRVSGLDFEGHEVFKHLGSFERDVGSA